MKSHSDRLHAATTVGRAGFITICSVVVCKRLLVDTPLAQEDLFTFRMLLERLSWLARREQTNLSYTLVHVRRFTLAKLRQYEAKLREIETTIEWSYLDEHSCRLGNDQDVKQLQLADVAASATAQAFEPDPHGNTEQRYLRELSARMYRHGTGAKALRHMARRCTPGTTQPERLIPG